MKKVKVLPDVRVRMRDGVELAVRIICPDNEGRFPAVMGYNPYRILPLLKAAPSEREYSTFFHAPHYLAERGYVCVHYDPRGTGVSGGATSDLYSEEERQDGYDMVEWVAAQPWSNGNVGMWGFSFGGIATWQVAAMAPPHLKAIIVGSGTDHLYEDWAYPGGLPRPFVLGPYAATMAAFNFLPPCVDSAGEQWAALWDEHLQNNAPWSLASLEHQTDGEYWRAKSLRPDYGRIGCAVFLISGWADWYPTSMLRAYAELKGPKRILIGPWGHYWPEDALPGPRIDARAEYLKWFDQFLKGIDTGVLSEPPVTIFVNDYQRPALLQKEQVGFWRRESDWPPARVRDTPLYLGAHGQLNLQVHTATPVKQDRYPYRPSAAVTSGVLAITPPVDQRLDEAHSLTYTSQPLQADLEVAGHPTATLFISSTAHVAYFHVRLCDVAPDGTSRLVSDGGLNATHRASHREPEPLKPNEIYELQVGLKALAYVFRAGHCIRVAVSSTDFQNGWPVSAPAVNAVARGSRYPSQVNLPVVPPQTPRLPNPRLLPSPNPLPEFVPLPDHTVHYDPNSQLTTLTMKCEASRTSYRVSDLHPAEAVLESSAEYEISSPGRHIKVAAQAQTSSDAKMFRHDVQVDITVNGKRHFSKHWTMAVPRALN